MTDLTEVTLDTVCAGRAPAVFQHLFNQVLANVRDPNTKPDQTRRVHLIFECTPAKSRAEMEVDLKSKIEVAAVEAQQGHVFMRHGRDGTFAATQDVRQESFGFVEEEVAAAAGEEGNEQVRDGEVTS